MTKSVPVVSTASKATPGIGVRPGHETRKRREIPFGIYTICGNKLDSHVLSLRTKAGQSVHGFPCRPLTAEVAAFLRALISGVPAARLDTRGFTREQRHSCRALLLRAKCDVDVDTLFPAEPEDDTAGYASAEE